MFFLSSCGIFQHILLTHATYPFKVSFTDEYSQSQSILDPKAALLLFSFALLVSWPSVFSP